MGRKAKLIETKEGVIDLATYSWDDDRFSRALKQQHPMDDDKAHAISRFVREALEELKVYRITPPIVEAVVKATLEEHGVPKVVHVPLDKSLFTRNGLNLSDNAKKVLERRYLRKDADGKPLENPSQMFRRVARHIAQAELKFNSDADVHAVEESFYELMTDLKFLPNSPTLMNAGRRLGQLAACFVLPVEDSMEAIFETLKNAAIIHKSGGGTGFSFSRLRPKNATVGTTGGVASGPVSFMKIFNTATEQVKQGGTRRGANMGILKVDHPDIMEFIFCKQNNDELNNFNISVGLTEPFMGAVVKGETYPLIDPASKKTVTTLDAREVYGALVQQAWKNGDPGIVFLDRMNQDNPTPEIGAIESTNPCGEQPLLPMEACNLGSINLARCLTSVDNDSVAMDYEALRQVVHTSVHFLDNTIEMSLYPLPAIDAMVKGNRKVGLGVMGFADLLYLLKIPYNSEAALKLAEELMAFIQTEAHAASVELAKKRGPFLNFESSIYKKQNQPPLRNATLTTIAPTGTLSIIANCSSGIEPLFALSFVRTVMDNDRLIEVNPIFEAVARARGFYSPALMETSAAKGSIQGIEVIPEDVKKVFVTAHDISPEWHVRMQSAFQKHTDNAVSKTVNLPHDATVEDVRKIYDLSYQLGCKGVTIYRDGSKENQVLATAGTKAEGAAKESPRPSVRERPETLEGFTTKIRTGYGQLYVTVTEFNGRPFEVFATIGKSGRSTTAKTEAIGRLVSLALRTGVEVTEIVNQLKGISGEHPIFQEGGLVLSIPDAIARVLERRYLTKESAAKSNQVNSLLGGVCPECGQTISFEEGCQTCHFCGFTKCG
ncbi:MAG: vitamin B12-dependent ribonucleotide reductase [Desulfobacteraceae bacterium]|nr:vitamin B12-dependent ribonucleotide reductase [Desulfobacteraceae bacterium]